METSDVTNFLQIGDISGLLACLAKKQYSLMMLLGAIFR